MGHGGPLLRKTFACLLSDLANERKKVMSEEREAARQYLIETCLKLALDEEARFDPSVVRMAFPAAVGGRSSEDQLLDNLPGSHYRAFQCRRDIPTGDYIVSRHEPSDKAVRKD
jgi:hypothetical protein